MSDFEEQVKRLKQIVAILAAGNPETAAIAMRYRMSEDEDQLIREVQAWADNGKVQPPQQP